MAYIGAAAAAAAGVVAGWYFSFLIQVGGGGYRGLSGVIGHFSDLSFGHVTTKT